MNYDQYTITDKPKRDDSVWLATRAPTEWIAVATVGLMVSDADIADGKAHKTRVSCMQWIEKTKGWV